MRTLFYNGNIVTSKPAAAVLVEDAVILGVYDRVPDVDADRRVDLQGCTLMPAFIDAHSHLLGGATALLQVPLDGAASLDEMIGRVQAFIRGNRVPQGQWVTAKGYDHTVLAERVHPTRQALDRAAPDNPLVAAHVSGHVGVFNTRALEALGVSVDTTDPEGGVIGRENGALTGYMEENAFLTRLRRVPMPGIEELTRAFVEVQRQYASFGIVTAQEGMLVEELVPLYRTFADRGAIELDVVAYADPPVYDRAVEAFGGCDKIRVGGIKLFLDGSPQGRTAWLRAPYAGETQYRGYGTMTDAALEEALERAWRQGAQPLVHCNGDAAAGQLIDAALRLKARGCDLSPLRPVMIHAQVLGADQIPAMKEAGIMPSFFVAHVYRWGDTHIRNLGLERASGISPAASAQTAGIPYTFHQDAPVIAPDMLETVWCAVCRQTKAGVTLGLDQAVTPLEALKAVTVNAAYQYGEEKTTGSIAPGKRADLVVLDKDPVRCPAEELREIQVLATLKRGRAIYVR